MKADFIKELKQARDNLIIEVRKHDKFMNLEHAGGTTLRVAAEDVVILIDQVEKIIEQSEKASLIDFVKHYNRQANNFISRLICFIPRDQVFKYLNEKNEKSSV